MTQVVSVRFKAGGKCFYFNPGEIEISAGRHVIVETARGVEYGECVRGNHEVEDAKIVPPLQPVIRIASESDRQTMEANRNKAARAYSICNEKIAEHQLEMKLVDVEYNFEGSKILFFFTADGRVDFRDLVKDLAAIFRIRIELRQIGVRDEAKILGGLGICGKEFCCTQFLDEFQPVSIKMAKTQSLSLNPAKISGTCGRLMCCLKYEQDAYESLTKNAPKMDSYVQTPEGNGTVTDVNLLRQTVKVKMDGRNGEILINSYTMDEITFIKTGKQRRADLLAQKETSEPEQSAAPKLRDKKLPAKGQRKPSQQQTPKSELQGKDSNKFGGQGAKKGDNKAQKDDQQHTAKKPPNRKKRKPAPQKDDRPESGRDN